MCDFDKAGMKLDRNHTLASVFFCKFTANF